MFESHGAPDLEAQLPAFAGGIPLARFSLTGEDMLASGDRATVETLLALLGKDAADVRIAAAVDQSGNLGAWVTAFRVEGVDAGGLRTALGTVAMGVSAPVPMPSPTTVAGKQVIQVTLGPTMPEALRAVEAHYLYAAGEVVYFVHGTTAGASTLIGSLP
jgi:hypothetical protein